MLILFKDNTCTNSIKAIYGKGVFLALTGLILTEALVLFNCSVLSHLIYSKWWILAMQFQSGYFIYPVFVSRFGILAEYKYKDNMTEQQHFHLKSHPVLNFPRLTTKMIQIWCWKIIFSFSSGWLRLQFEEVVGKLWKREIFGPDSEKKSTAWMVSQCSSQFLFPDG